METYDPHKSTTEMRQGNRRKGNFRVLVIGTLAIIIAFAIIWGIYQLMPEGNVIS